MAHEIIIKNTKGLHASLAAKLVQVTSKYDVEVELYYKDMVVDLKSILGLMSLAIPKGENVRVKAQGKDAWPALKEIEVLLNRKEG